MREQRKDETRRAKIREAIKHMVSEQKRDLIQVVDFDMWDRSYGADPDKVLTWGPVVGELDRMLLEGFDTIKKHGDDLGPVVDDMLKSVEDLIDEFAGYYDLDDIDAMENLDQFHGFVDSACGGVDATFQYLVDKLEDARKQWNKGRPKLLKRIEKLY